MAADYCQRFIFEHFDIRGEIVQLEQSYAELLSKHHYPTPVANLLGEFLSACVLLSLSIKYQGKLSLQARSNGPVPLITVDCTSDLQVRGLAQLTEQAVGPALDQLLVDGILAITIEPTRGERYQGLVPLAEGGLSACLEHYFHQSEQLETRFYLASDGRRAAGFMLQQLPGQLQVSEWARVQAWEHLSALAQTVELEELLHVESEQLLYRLFHQEQVRTFEPRPVDYRCTCSWERSANTLVTLGREEISEILDEREEVEMTCEFCNQVYRFDRPSIERIFGDDFPSDASGSPALH